MSEPLLYSGDGIAFHLLGIPVRIVVSQKLQKNGDVEIKIRKSGEVRICPESELYTALEGIMKDLQPSFEGLPYMAEI